MLFLSACCIAIPLLVAWGKLWLWDRQARLKDAGSSETSRRD